MYKSSRTGGVLYIGVQHFSEVSKFDHLCEQGLLAADSSKGFREIQHHGGVYVSNLGGGEEFEDGVHRF